MRARPISPGLVVEELCDRIAAAMPGATHATTEEGGTKPTMEDRRHSAMTPSGAAATMSTVMAPPCLD